MGRSSGTEVSTEINENQRVWDQDDILIVGVVVSVGREERRGEEREGEGEPIGHLMPEAPSGACQHPISLTFDESASMEQ